MQPPIMSPTKRALARFGRACAAPVLCPSAVLYAFAIPWRLLSLMRVCPPLHRPLSHRLGRKANGA